MLHAAWAPLAAFSIALILIWRLSRGRLARMVVDRPNERSLHSTVIPRSGGLGLHAGILLAWFITGVGIPAFVFFPLIILLVISVLDDIRGVPVLVRLISHLLAGGVVSAFLLLPDFGLAAVFVSTLAIVWMTNLYNFMDGSDGLAGGMALFGFTCYGVAAYFSGDMAFALLYFSIASAAAAFLCFNFHPARVFMGDAGSVPLGFLAGSLGLLGCVQHHWPWWFPLMVFSPFIVDASVTLAKRVYARAPFWRAHRDHYYQRLVQMGWGHRRTALAEYALMGICAAAALVGLNATASGLYILLAMALAAYAALIVSIECAWRKFQTASHHES